ncbi:hypothetical protein [Roseimaritima ulvae]|uniref:Uncharacterized protein n=1 Tax=Roseimaritima ulvae TaxID=980254 RepID=A0A5B9QXL2_9BACT|nr:hypothetical protein [Roseimaritima ulvae]QEG43757.1 hypothetical protein UC8_58120 [Roseimaritima ulvae]
MIEPGAKLDIQYPCCTLVETLNEFRLRRIHVQSVRDLVASPLTPEEYLHRPFVRRSRWLVIGFDEVAGAMRKFYLGSSRELCRPGLMRLGLYEPGATAPYAIVSRPFLETRRDRLLLAAVLMRQSESENDLAGLRLRILADDLQLRPTA